MKQQLFMNESGFFFFWVGLIYELLSLRGNFDSLVWLTFFFPWLLLWGLVV